MEEILSPASISMTEFQKDPMAAVKDAKGHALAVLDREEVAFYLLEPALLRGLLEEIADRDLYDLALSRLADRANAIEVDIETL